MLRRAYFVFPHRAAAAFFAISLSRSGDRLFARARPPLPLPLICAMYADTASGTFFRFLAI